MAGDWTVNDPYGGAPRVFTGREAALAYAHGTARSDQATLVTAPDGEQILILRVDPRVQIQAVRPLTPGGGR
jgi:hypothetical protein